MITATAGDLWKELPFDFKRLTTPLFNKTVKQHLLLGCPWGQSQIKKLKAHSFSVKKKRQNGWQNSQKDLHVPFPLQRDWFLRERVVLGRLAHRFGNRFGTKLKLKLKLKSLSVSVSVSVPYFIYYFTSYTITSRTRNCNIFLINKHLYSTLHCVKTPGKSLSSSLWSCSLTSSEKLRRNPPE